MEAPTRKEIIMIPLSAVARFKWDKTLGSRLQVRRKNKKYSRSILAQKINEIDPTLEACTIGQIQKYEEAIPQAISADLAAAIAIALNTDLPSLLGINVSVFILSESEKIV